MTFLTLVLAVIVGNILTLAILGAGLLLFACTAFTDNEPGVVRQSS